MKRKKILVIDDFAPLLEDVVEFLSMEGYKTYSAKDGTEGVQMAMQYKPDLIICDIEMPKMNGYDVFKTLEKIPGTSAIPFIFLTARAQVEDYKIGLQLGADDYITKPLELENLLISISKRLKKHERIKAIHRKRFDFLLKNPLIGIFIYSENNFLLVNEKIEEITGYSKNKLNKLKIKDFIISDNNVVISKMKSCLNNIHDSFQLKLSIVKKNKKAVFVELFAKYIEVDAKNAIIGIVVEITPENTKNNSNNTTKEFSKIVDYLISIGKKQVADEIINIKDLLSFEGVNKIQTIKQKIKLTKREQEILDLICEGYTNNEIAEKLFISSRTVDNHRANLLSKTSTKNTASLVAFAYKNNLLTN